MPYFVFQVTEGGDCAGENVVHYMKITTKIAGICLIVVGIVQVYITIDLDGFAPLTAMLFLLSGAAIALMGYINAAVRGKSISEWTLAPNTLGLLYCVEASYIIGDAHTLAGSFLFGVIALRSLMVLVKNRLRALLYGVDA